MKVKSWKFALSVIIAMSIGLALLNVRASSFGFSASSAPIDSSVFYVGVTIIVLAIVILCVVIITCTSYIIKAINSKK